MATADEKFTPTVFTRTDDDGTKHELTATSPSDAVRLTFDGWSEKTGKAGNSKAPAAS